MSTNRIDKVNSLLEHEISKIIQREISFPDNILATLTHVKATANLIEAKVYISVFPEEKADEAMKTLKKEVYSIQQEINKKLNMRPIPKIIFVIDKKEAEANRVEELLAQLKNSGK
jgi:ribosome-binding factor A